MINKSELETLVSEIKKSTKQISINKVDEVRVMRSMLNDSEFTIGVYDRAQGKEKKKCPHNDAVKFVKNVIQDATGLDSKDSQHLADQYTFTNRDANFLLSNMRDFLYVYTKTGRKINVMQTADAEASLFVKEVSSTEKKIPDRDNPGKTKDIKTNPYTKLVSVSRCPKYNMEEE